MSGKEGKRRMRFPHLHQKEGGSEIVSSFEPVCARKGGHSIHQKESGKKVTAAKCVLSGKRGMAAYFEKKGADEGGESK